MYDLSITTTQMALHVRYSTTKQNNNVKCPNSSFYGERTFVKHDCDCFLSELNAGKQYVLRNENRLALDVRVQVANGFGVLTQGRNILLLWLQINHIC